MMERLIMMLLPAHISLFCVDFIRPLFKNSPHRGKLPLLSLEVTDSEAIDKLGYARAPVQSSTTLSGRYQSWHGQ